MARDDPLDAVFSLFSTPIRFSELRELQSNTSAKPAENLDSFVTPTAKSVTPEQDGSYSVCNSHNSVRSPRLVGELQEKPKEFQGDADDRNSVTRVTPINEEGSNGTGSPNGAGGARRPPAWAELRDMPHPGDRCHCCHGSLWWTETDEPLGWRCWTCHPPHDPSVRQVRT